MTSLDEQNQRIAQWEPRRDRIRRALVFATAFALTAAAVLVPVDEVQGAPRFNVQCDELIDGIEGIADLEELPGGGLDSGYDERIDDYEYDNPAEQLRPRQKPTQAELDALQGSYEDFEPGTEDHMLRRWKVYEGDYEWERWRNTYIPAVSNDFRGDGFHRNVARRLKLGGDQWICEDNKLWEEEKLETRRRYDSVNRTLKIAYELKSGNSPLKIEQLRADAALRAKGWRVVYIFSQDPKPGQLRLLQQYGVEHTKLRSTAVPRNPPQPINNALSPNPQRPTGGAVKDLAQRSGGNANAAREGQRIQNQIAGDTRRPGFSPGRPGGIDWTSLELRYVSENPANKDFEYAFSAAELADEGEAEPSYGGEAPLDLSSDALFTWLALDPNQFWVNLNPDTPETIIDEQFATTDAGRVLLEADLAFKRTIADHMNPETETGQAFWDSVERTDDGLICHGWYRFWVDPKPATVREDGDQLYILDAPLRAQIEPIEVDWELPGEDLCADAPEDLVDRNTQLLADTFAPLLEQAVNTAPEYADLRRVYTARVAAEWLKQRDAERPGAFHDVIGSGDVSGWPARTEWDPQDVFDAYLERLQTPLYRYEWTHGDMEYWLEITGGIQFPDAPRDPMPAERFESEHPTLPKTVRSAAYEAVSVPVAAQTGDAIGTLAEDTESMAWLGGGPVVQLPGPDPTDPPDPGPTDPPNPGPTDPGPGPGPGNPPDDGPAGGDQPTVPEADLARNVVPASGPLPATGYSQPWIIPTAIALVLAGLVLVALRHRWPRRQ
ncbi:hypothetical protein L1785_08755 [Antribacter sp. KLBMP9083]|uniref:LPXTG cell wall anchor domain-containing protein n=1 Tax=Antribacter soli TaxID=2910976 RepID=A0AA41QE16_9MICO|nr:hypothetical protein [Antribacter soli]MCF4121070.1 hypothetical protein [Antribacter soli]